MRTTCGALKAIHEARDRGSTSRRAYSATDNARCTSLHRPLPPSRLHGENARRLSVTRPANDGRAAVLPKTTKTVSFGNSSPGIPWQGEPSEALAPRSPHYGPLSHDDGIRLSAEPDCAARCRLDPPGKFALPSGIANAMPSGARPNL